MITEDRVVEMAFKCSRGELDDVANWLESLGCKIIYKTEGEVIVEGLTGLRLGLIHTDPVTCVVVLGFVLAGEYWIRVYPDLLKKTNKTWTQQSRENKLRKREIGRGN